MQQQVRMTLLMASTLLWAGLAQATADTQADPLRPLVDASIRPVLKEHRVPGMAGAVLISWVRRSAMGFLRIEGQQAFAAGRADAAFGDDGLDQPVWRHVEGRIGDIFAGR